MSCMMIDVYYSTTASIIYNEAD